MQQSSWKLSLREMFLYLPVGIKTLFLLASAPWPTILSMTYGTVEPFFVYISKFSRTESSLANGRTRANSDNLHPKIMSHNLKPSHNEEKLAVWLGRICSSTAAQAARCFEASISVVTTKIGGISSGAERPDPAANEANVAINRTGADSHQ